jgi:hypothetical protein
MKIFLSTLQLLIIISLQTFSQEIVFKYQSKLFTTKDIEMEIAKYPNVLLKVYLPTIKIVNDENICGRAEWDTLILSSTCNSFQQTIHHELSSILLNKYDVYVKPVYDSIYREFVKLNGDFRYDRSRVSMNRIESGSKLAEYFYGYTYATTDFENDFNIIAECLFTDGSEVIDFMNCNSSKPVSKKIRLVLNFYHSLDPSFTNSYFRKQKI